MVIAYPGRNMVRAIWTANRLMDMGVPGESAADARKQNAQIRGNDHNVGVIVLGWMSLNDMAEGTSLGIVCYWLGESRLSSVSLPESCDCLTSAQPFFHRSTKGRTPTVE